jgi:hypothetical protein
MSNQYTGGVTQMPFQRWKPVHYCCPGHTPRWKGRAREGRMRMRQKAALQRDLAAYRNGRL